MLTDLLLEQVAELLATTITHFGITETVITPDPTDTSLSGELTGRSTMSNTVVDNEVIFLGVRSSADVIDTVNGDDWKGIGFFNASTSGDLADLISTTGINQTTSFDVEVQLSITPSRS